jgi:hypothetical protein
LSGISLLAGGLTAACFHSIYPAALIAFRYAERGGANFRRASREIKLGAATWVCLVVFNHISIVFFS